MTALTDPYAFAAAWVGVSAVALLAYGIVDSLRGEPVDPPRAQPKVPPRDQCMVSSPRICHERGVHQVNGWLMCERHSLNSEAV